MWIQDIKCYSPQALILQPAHPHRATIFLCSPLCPPFLALTPLPSYVIFLYTSLSCVFPRKLSQMQCLNTHIHFRFLTYVPSLSLFGCPCSPLSIHLFVSSPFLHHIISIWPFSPSLLLSSPLLYTLPVGGSPVTNPLGCSAASLPGFSGSGFVRETPVSLSLPVLMAD